MHIDYEYDGIIGKKNACPQAWWGLRSYTPFSQRRGKKDVGNLEESKWFLEGKLMDPRGIDDSLDILPGCGVVFWLLAFSLVDEALRVGADKSDVPYGGSVLGQIRKVQRKSLFAVVGFKCLQLKVINILHQQILRWHFLSSIIRNSLFQDGDFL